MRVFLTHSKMLSQATQDRLLDKGIELIHYPCLGMRLRPSSLVGEIEHLIPSSLTAVEWLIQQEVFAQYYYCIGDQTAAALKAKRSCANIMVNVTAPSTLKNLLNTFYSQMKGRIVWLGSQQGVLRYHHEFDSYYHRVEPFLTHWNWPSYFQETKASSYFEKVDFVVCSSISAAVSLSQLQWDCAALILLSSSRLIKYFSLDQSHVKVCQDSWIQELCYTQ